MGEASISKARIISVVRALYFPSLLLDLNLNFRVYSISTLPGPSNLVGELGVHESLAGGANILKAIGHDIVLVVIVILHEGNFWGVHGIHMNLVIPQISIHEA